ncbi:Uncharacterized ACR, COG1565 [Neisseria gonorrhoeae]|nr:Uncharacterized ACR, COG1565 [Neisseria gonorrhoeae]
MTAPVPTCNMSGNPINLHKLTFIMLLPSPKHGNPRSICKPSLPKKSANTAIGFHFHVLWNWFYTLRNTATTPAAAIKSAIPGILLPHRPSPLCLHRHWHANFKKLLPQTAGNIYEFGAGTGQLAADLLAAFQTASTVTILLKYRRELAARQKNLIQARAPGSISKSCPLDRTSRSV